MTEAELVGLLARNGASLERRGDRLRYHGPADLLTDELREKLTRRMDDLITWLKTPIDDLPPGDLAELDYVPTSGASGLAEQARREIWVEPPVTVATDRPPATRPTESVPRRVRPEPERSQPTRDRTPTFWDEVDDKPASKAQGAAVLPFLPSVPLR